MDKRSVRNAEKSQPCAALFAEARITFSEIVDLWKKTRPRAEPDIPFPQANSFERVLDLVFLLRQGGLIRDDIAQKYQFTLRQVDYYTSAGEYLGLVERAFSARAGCQYRLSSEAKQILNLPHRLSCLAFVKKILKYPVFNRTFALTVLSETVPEKDAICRVMEESGLAMRQKTMRRRASTVRSWIDWILKMATSGPKGHACRPSE